jgi:predicted small lipoprotein YifL
MRRLCICLLVFALLSLAGCGNKGPLVHPDQAPAPATSR